MKPERRKRPGMPPLSVQLAVALAQYFRLTPEQAANSAKVVNPVAHALNRGLSYIAGELGCEVADLQLDHTLPLRDREYRPRKGIPVASWYTPHAHDPAYLRWRSKRRQDPDSHAIKTFVRGDHGQLSDVALAKRARRREKNPDKWTALRGLKKPKRRASKSTTNLRSGKRKLTGRGFQPPGSRPFRRKP